ncbi:MAG: tRNA dihydrouridine synthase DusB [Ruminococcaceae bacterium]|nr:tRNA dihydrouridine synthase DusB [Oscillospiraceae bacterium]
MKNGIKLMLAPMAGYTDRHFRRICAELGADLAVTEMISAKALCYEQKGRRDRAKTAELAYIERGIPTSVQLFGSEPEFIAEAVKLLASGQYRGHDSEMRPAAIDINMGCPVKKVVQNGEGSALMKDPDRAAEIVFAAVRASALPVTVKMRAGWDSSSINAPYLAKLVEEAGAASVCVHARTREQFYEPDPDISIIKEVKRAVNIPVFGNGGIFSAEDALKMIEATGCDGLAIARGALGNPWIFREIRAALDGKEYTPPSNEERIAAALDHVRAIIGDEGEAHGIAAARSQLSYYVKGMDGAAGMRHAINSAESFDELCKIFGGGIR